MHDTLNLAASVTGRCNLGTIYPGWQTAVDDLSGMKLLEGLWVPHGYDEHNLVMFEAATAIAELLRGAPNLKAYKLGGMYMEFENNGGAPVTPPTNTDRAAGKSYFDGLVSDPNRDYIRVPLTAQTLESSDATNYPNGNRVVNYAASTGIAGVHGKTFSHTVSSRVYGGALVVFPEESDSSQDIVFSRFYFSDENNQLVKQEGSQVSMTWPLTAE